MTKRISPRGQKSEKNSNHRESPTGAEIRKRGAPTNTSLSGAAKSKETKSFKSNTKVD